MPVQRAAAVAGQRARCRSQYKGAAGAARDPGRPNQTAHGGVMEAKFGLARRGGRGAGRGGCVAFAYRIRRCRAPFSLPFPPRPSRAPRAPGLASSRRSSARRAAQRASAPQTGSSFRCCATDLWHHTKKHAPGARCDESVSAFRYCFVAARLWQRGGGRKTKEEEQTAGAAAGSEQARGWWAGAWGH